MTLAKVLNVMIKQQTQGLPTSKVQRQEIPAYTKRLAVAGGSSIARDYPLDGATGTPNKGSRVDKNTGSSKLGNKKAVGKPANLEKIEHELSNLRRNSTGNLGIKMGDSKFLSRHVSVPAGSSDASKDGAECNCKTKASTHMSTTSANFRRLRTSHRKEMQACTKKIAISASHQSDMKLKPLEENDYSVSRSSKLSRRRYSDGLITGVLPTLQGSTLDDAITKTNTGSRIDKDTASYELSKKKDVHMPANLDKIESGVGYLRRNSTGSLVIEMGESKVLSCSLSVPTGSSREVRKYTEESDLKKRSRILPCTRPVAASGEIPEMAVAVKLQIGKKPLSSSKLPNIKSPETFQTQGKKIPTSTKIAVKNDNMATIALIFFLLLQLTTVTISTTPPPYNATVYVLLNCGVPSATTDDNDRRWDTDTHFPNFLPSNFSTISTTATAPEQDPSVDRVPYTTGARIMKSEFTYTFPLSPGAKFLRLYFYPADYPGFNKSESFFSVTANHLTLLSNFSAFLASTISSKKVQKEYVITVDETQMLKLTFSPSPNSYAFVNGIEILSMPTDLYIRGDDYDIKLVGQNYFYHINNNTALETVYRLEVGGNSVASRDDTGMYRVWDSDDEFVVGFGYQTPHFDVNINYTQGTPAYTAPRIVYTTSRTMANYSPSLDWEFPLNSGYFYLFRLHFCEIQPEVTEINFRSFTISIGNQLAELAADVIQWSGGWRVPVFRDYVVNVRNQDGGQSKQNVTLDLRPNLDMNSRYRNAILNGLEIFKLNDSNGNLSVPNPQVFVPINSPPSNNKKKSSHIVAVITAVAVISGIALFSVICFLIFRRWKREKDIHTSVTKSSWVPLSITSDSTQRTGGSVSSSLPSDLCRHFLLEEIKTATGNFDEKFVIGHGGFGNVYKGYIDNGATVVAVKRLNPSSKQGVREFETEIHMLSKLRHLHLVSLIGYCDDKNEMILVYDYMAHGTLRDHLYNTDNASLPWKKRLEICIGAAKGLYYLHTGTKHTIIHRDVKSTNILLDDKWVAKVSDFGLSKIGPLGGSGNTHVSTAVKGSFGYVDPEYYKRQQLTEKSDVYSFGVVLFEVLCARPALIPGMPKGQVNLADWACRCCKKGNLEQIIDSSLEGQIAPECLNKFAEAAYNCLKDQGAQRPSMSDVVWNLEFVLKLQDAADNRGHKMEGNSFPTSPSFPLVINGHTNISTDEGFEAFSGSYEVAGKSTSTSMTNSSDDKLKSETIFSQILNPSGR